MSGNLSTPLIMQSRKYTIISMDMPFQTAAHLRKKVNKRGREGKHLVHGAFLRKEKESEEEKGMRTFGHRYILEVFGQGI